MRHNILPVLRTLEIKENFDAEFHQEVGDLYDRIEAVNYQQSPETYDCSIKVNGEITQQEVMSTIKDKTP